MILLPAIDILDGKAVRLQLTGTSRITMTDGEQGVLLYRGYPIEQLAERAGFLEVAYLLVYGDLPTSQQLSVATDATIS